MEEKLLSIIIKADASRFSYEKAIRSTLKGIKKHCSENSDVEVILSFEELTEEIRAACSSIKFEPGFKLSEHKDIDSAVNGTFFTVVSQGDTFDKRYFEELLGELRKGQNDIFVITKSLKTNEDRIPNLLKSIFEEPFRIITTPQGAIFKRTERLSAGDMMYGDTRDCAAAVDAILTAKSFIELGYSAINTYKTDAHDSGTDLVPEAMDQMLERSEELYGRTEEYVQNVFYRLFSHKVEIPENREIIKNYINNVSDKVIINSRGGSIRRRFYLLQLKHGKDFCKDITVDDGGRVLLKNEYLCGIDQFNFRIDIIELDEGTIKIEGRTDLHQLGEGYRLCVVSDTDENNYLELKRFPPFDETGYDGEMIYEGMMFTGTMSLKAGSSYSFYFETPDLRKVRLIPHFGKCAGLINKVPRSYIVRSDHILRCDNGVLYIKKHTSWLRFKYEMSYMSYLLGQSKAKVVLYRLAYFIDSLFKRKPVWLVADRPHIANDNGEHMFRYLQTTESAKENNIYFVIREDSPDYDRLCRTGKVIKYGSFKHKIKTLEADVIMCAAANNLITNVMGKTDYLYHDLYTYHFVYLRHGVSHNDQSSWINKLDKNISILVATCRPEYEGVLNGYYDYTEKEVKLTGLPRYDNLKDAAEKKIAILPTWRKDLEGGMLYRSSEREYVVNFTNSDYFLFYNSLINDERLLGAMEEYGYTGCFYLHPAFEAQYKDFKSSRLITVGKGVADYQKVFRESAIMVTDYSSVAFDFAYLKKPVIYSQFDEETFYNNHTWGKGYFTYRTDGFGPITNTLDETVETLIRYIKNGCRMEEKYVNKVENFFAYTDRNNCRRVYEAVTELERKNK